LRDRLRHLPLRARLNPSIGAKALRLALVEDLPGIGPKQASMFLRNIGLTYELAVLDVHVLRYLQMIGLRRIVRIHRLADYEQAEAVATHYAIECGRPVGLLDWAIWITMQAAAEEKLQ